MNGRLWCLFKKEFGSYFRTRMAYVLLSVYLLLSMLSVFYRGDYFDLYNRTLFSFFYFQPEILVVLVPVLTMKLWADERRSGTIELLLSEPVDYGTLAAAKILSVWAFCAVMLAATLPLWLVTAWFIPTDVGTILSGYVACLLTGGALAAVGAAVSVQAKNPVTAYLAAFIAGWLMKLADFDWVLRFFKLSDELSFRIATALSFKSHFEDLMLGQPGWDDLGYFVSIILLGWWLNTMIIATKRD